jgi:hypothetical protein
MMYAVEEFTNIATEDKISEVQIYNVFNRIEWSLVGHWSKERLLEEVRKYSDQEIAASEIIGRIILSKRYAEKILSIISKYYSRPHDLRLLIQTVILLYNDRRQAGLSHIISALAVIGILRGI